MQPKLVHREISTRMEHCTTPHLLQMDFSIIGYFIIEL